MWRQIFAKIASIIYHENWMIGVIDAPIHEAIDWKILPPVCWTGARSNGYYLADPFPHPADDTIVLCEKYDFKTRLGSIRQIRIDGTRIIEEVPVDFNLSGHLSYPYTFADEGRVYCLPESSSARKLILFEWDEGGKDWKELVVLLDDVAAADATLFRHGQYFWIAYTDIDIGPFDNLNLCFAETLSGPWVRHAGNPVRRDIRSSRCGGTPFAVGNRLFRPAQDCSLTYGGSVRIMEIIECSPRIFQEKEITHIKPGPGENSDGFHTLSAFGDKCLIDGKKMMISPARILQKIRRRILNYRRL